MAIKNNKLSVLLVVLLVVVGIVTFNMFSELKRAENTKQNIKQSAQTTTEPPKEVKLATPEEVLIETNKLRAEVGVAPLGLDERLSQSAKLKAQDMVENEYFGHPNPKTGKQGYQYAREAVGRDCIKVGENLSGETPSRINAKGWVEGWKSSEPHYKAMINPNYKSIGFAAIQNGGWDQYYGVMHFCAK